MQGDSSLSVELNPEGYLRDIACWTPEVAGELARDEGLDCLDEVQWRVVQFIHSYYRRFGLAPSVRKLCHSLELDPILALELFPRGLARGGCRIAGLPSPDGCW